MSQTTIDDQDLSKVKYTGTWIQGGTSHENDGTVASSTNVGDFFTVSFKGTLIEVYGTIDSTSGGVLTKYSIDGAPAAQATSQAGSGDTYRQQFWSSDALTLNDHILTVTMAKVNTNQEAGEGTVWFDFFVVTNPTITSTSASETSSAPASESTNHVPLGAIVGGVVGGVLFLLAAVIFLLYYRHRRRTAISASKSNLHDSPPALDIMGIPVSEYTEIQPLSWSPSGDTYITSSAPANAIGVQANPSPMKVSSRPRQISESRNLPSRDTPPEATSSANTSNDALSSPRSHRMKVPPGISPLAMAQQHPELVQHVDSGIRTADQEQIGIAASIVELPPIYSAV